MCSQEEHSKVFSQLNFVLMLAELLSDLAVSCGAPIAALMDASDGEHTIIHLPSIKRVPTSKTQSTGIH